MMSLICAIVYIWCTLFGIVWRPWKRKTKYPEGSVNDCRRYLWRGCLKCSQYSPLSSLKYLILQSFTTTIYTHFVTFVFDAIFFIFLSSCNVIYYLCICVWVVLSNAFVSLTLRKHKRKANWPNRAVVVGAKCPWTYEGLIRMDDISVSVPRGIQCLENSMKMQRISFLKYKISFFFNHTLSSVQRVKYSLLTTNGEVAPRICFYYKHKIPSNSILCAPFQIQMHWSFVQKGLTLCVFTEKREFRDFVHTADTVGCKIIGKRKYTLTKSLIAKKFLEVLC